MIERGTSRFDDPGEYEANFGDTGVNLTITGAGDFKAELLQLKLDQLVVFRLRERLPRIAYFSLNSDRALVFFVIGPGSLVFDGFVCRSGHIAFVGPGQHFHQRSSRACQWGLISLSLQQLAKSGMALIGREIGLSESSRLLCPSAGDLSRLHCLYRQACHLAASGNKLIERPEVARALEQELLYAVIHCLNGDETEDNPRTRQKHAALMARFEQALRNSDARKLKLPDLCEDVGVAERTLRMCSQAFFGVSPMRYLLLHRLNKVRAALRHADPSRATVAKIARDHQFLELGRFAVMYRAAFGESPSTTLQRRCSGLAECA